MTPPNTELAEAIDNIKDMSGTYCHLNAKDIRDVQTILKAARSTLTRPTISGELDDALYQAALLAKTLIKFQVKPEKCVDRNDVTKSALEIYEMLVTALASRNLITAKRTEGWQDISTAPKTGESILIAAWHGEKVNLWQSVCYGHYYKTQGRFVYDGYSFGHPTGKMTHWMPLPKPPQPTAEDRGV